MHTYEKPKTEKDDSRRGGTIETHPAYAQISANRVTGSTFLYGSDFAHHHYVTVAILRSELRRDLSNDWVHGRDELIEVALSEAQWASFVSSMNHGSGPQCTLTHLNGKLIPQIPEAPKRAEQFSSEVEERLGIATKGLDDLRAKIGQLKISEKQKKDLLNSVESVDRNIGPNIEFVEKQFGEHMERTVEAAKVEVNAYMMNVVTRAGLAALKSSDKPFEMVEGHVVPQIGDGSDGGRGK